MLSEPSSRGCRSCLDLSPLLRQPVKTQDPANGGMSHGIVSTEEVLTGVQAGRPSAAGMGPSVAMVGCAFDVSPERAAQLASRVQRRSGDGLPVECPLRRG